MHKCIACSKKLSTNHSSSVMCTPDDDDAAAVTPNTRQALKSLKSQIKDMALKASGAYKYCSKPCSRSDTNYADTDWPASRSDQFQYSYKRAGGHSLSSTPRLFLRGSSSGDATPMSTSETIEEEMGDGKEWVAQVEPGVLITFVSAADGGNEIKRIRFSREMFNKREAQRWWAENKERVMELYNVQKRNGVCAPVPAPQRSEGEISKVGSAEDSPVRNKGKDVPTVSSGTSGEGKTETSSMRSSSSEADGSASAVSVASDVDREWVEEDEPGVYITIRLLTGGVRELRRVRFSRERFGEMHARLWWDKNRSRIHQQYL